MVGESNQNVFLLQIDASSFAEFEISEFEISRVDCNVDVSIHSFLKASMILNEKVVPSNALKFGSEAESQLRLVNWSLIDSTCVISSSNPMFDHLLESSHLRRF